MWSVYEKVLMASYVKLMLNQSQKWVTNFIIIILKAIIKSSTQKVHQLSCEYFVQVKNVQKHGKQIN